MDPTYRRLGDHSEALQVDFDSTIISFERLLQEFWQEHDPCGASWSTQYKAVLFYGSEAQRRAAQASAEAVAAATGRSIMTEVVALDRFWPAEDYHQKYALRRNAELTENLLRLLGSEAELRDSVLATKLNAYCAGEIDLAGLDRQLQQTGFRLRADRSAVVPR